MARTIRPESAGAAGHVMARGNQGQAVFSGDLDRTTWIMTLAEACEIAGRQVLAISLRENHFHLVVETSPATSSRDAGEPNRIRYNLGSSRLLKVAEPKGPCKNKFRFCGWGFGAQARRDEGRYPQWSLTEE